MLLSISIYLAVHSQHTVQSGYFSSAVPTCLSSPSLVPTILDWRSYWTLCLVQSLHNPSKCFLLSLFSGTTAPLLVRSLSHQTLSEVSGTNQPQNNKQNPGKFYYMQSGTTLSGQMYEGFPGKHIVGFLSSGGSDDRLVSGPGSPGLPWRPLSWPGSLPDPRRIPAQAK